MTLPKEFLESDWYKSRPEVVKKAYQIWEPNSIFLIDEKVYYMLGVSETNDSQITNDPYDVMLVLSEIDPCKDYDNAMKIAIRMCAKHFHKEIVQ